MASRGYERVAVRDLQLGKSVPLRRTRLNLVRLSQPCQQRLSLGDLGHFWCRRKAFERGGEDGVGVGGAAGRLIKLGKRQHGAQFKTAGGLLLCDGDGAPHGLLGRRRVGGIAPEQHFAARTVKFRCEGAKVGAIRRG